MQNCAARSNACSTRTVPRLGSSRCPRSTWRLRCSAMWLDLAIVLSWAGKRDAADSVLETGITTVERHIDHRHHDVRQVYEWLSDVHHGE